MKIKLLLIEDNAEIAVSIIKYFSEQEEFEIVGHFASMELFFENTSTLLVPDMILLDIQLPGISGVKGIYPTLQMYPDAKIVMNTIVEDKDDVYESLKAGALSYITKDTPLKNMKEILLLVNKGGSFMNARIARKIVDYFRKEPEIKDKLTEKEWLIANGIKDGKSYKMVAAENNMTIDGVRFYVQKIYRKLNINSKAELASFYLK